MRLCGYKEKCFKKGKQWKHCENTMCYFLGEDNNNFVCSMTDETVSVYTTEIERRRIITLELEKYANLCNDEYGEMCRKLLELQQYAPYFLNDEFNKILINEIQDNLENFKNNSKIIEKTETYTNTYKELEWI